MILSGQKNMEMKNASQNTGHFDDRADAQRNITVCIVRWCMPQGFTRSHCHWVLPPDEHLQCIAPAADMVVDVDLQHKSLPK
jgi:hypothetical protein